MCFHPQILKPSLYTKAVCNADKLCQVCPQPTHSEAIASVHCTKLTGCATKHNKKYTPVVNHSVLNGHLGNTSGLTWNKDSGGDCVGGVQETWRPLLLVIPLRLGLSDINPVYVNALKVGDNTENSCMYHGCPSANNGHMSKEHPF